MPMRGSSALCLSIVLHAIALILLGGSTAFDTQHGRQGTPLPPMMFEVSIETPQIDATQKASFDAVPPEHASREKSSRLDDAVRLLTPPPIPAGVDESKKPAIALTPGIGGPTYVPASALTISPRPTSEPEFILPSGRREAFGKAELTLYVSESGKLDKVTMGETELPPDLQKAVRNAFERLDFQPGEIDGRPVASVMVIEAEISISSGSLR